MSGLSEAIKLLEDHARSLERGLSLPDVKISDATRERRLHQIEGLRLGAERLKGIQAMRERKGTHIEGYELGEGT